MSEHAPFFFDSWYYIGRAAALSALGFVAMVVMLRGSGKRTLSKLNVFDFVFVVACGSVLAATIISKDTTLAEGIVSLGVLVSIQVVLAKIAAYSPAAERIINGEPTLLFSNGRFIDYALKRERVTREEVRAAIREEGITNVEDVTAVVLENDGTLTVAWDSHRAGRSALVDAKLPKKEKGHRKS
ncbi:MAG TPA: YetF domain-containing protein [Gemmatimonadaceae bacterium]|jgi:uncharacterized membrane protein YcaP (DUF421 family)|nr:YetF domain-containing protein [Gemmatimonadaceae bacterium]